MKDDPIWLDTDAIRALHALAIEEFGGISGVRNAALLDSALNRARNQFAYGESELCTLAALYAYGVVNNHPFLDGNKRTGFLAAALFLERNEMAFVATEVDAAIMTLGLADKSVNEAGYAQWLRDNVKKR